MNDRDEELPDEGSLQFFINYYGLLGLQLRAIRLLRYEWLHLVCQLAAIIVTCWSMWCTEPYQAQVDMRTTKPLLRECIHFHFAIFVPLQYPLLVGYFAIFGRRIGRLLQDATDLMRSIDEKIIIIRRRNWFAIFVGTQIWFLISYWCMFKNAYVGSLDGATIFLDTIGAYCVFQVLIAALLAAHYVRHIMLQALKIFRKRKRIERRKIIDWLRRSAAINRRINQMIAFPIAMLLLDLSLCSITIVSIVNDFFDLLTILSFALAVVYLRYITSLDDQIRRTLKQISYAGGDANELLPHLLPIYGEQLRWTLFDLCRIDSRFLMQLAVFLINYGVLITQTK